MNNNYEEFVKHIFYEHLEKRLTYVRDRFRPGHLEELGHRVTRLTRAMRAARFVKDFPESDENIIRIFTPGNLYSAMFGRSPRQVEIPPEQFRAFVLKCFAAVVEEREPGIQGYRRRLRVQELISTREMTL